MIYLVLADAVVFIHFLWILFLVFGAIPGRRNRTVRIFHLSGLFFALVIQIFDWYCPLTHIEVWLRARHDPLLTYSGSFIIHYLENVIYVSVPRLAVAVATVLICLFNGWLYLRKR
ncbi:MAG: DUF2784 domain-containing protein [Nitrospirae bacterium]|nr:DUF2784 domain-containing protein [Nitrospirota bacterium]